jgi:hypothetical protein
MLAGIAVHGMGCASGIIVYFRILKPAGVPDKEKSCK